MNIDERLEKLTERHEALTQTVELITADLQTLKTLAQQDGENIRALARIAEIHEKRLTGIEGGV
jgi:archaellum component FlaC